MVTYNKEQETVAATNVKSTNAWTASEKFGFRVICIFVLQLCVPYRARFYEGLFGFEWLSNWQRLSGLTGIGSPQFIDVGDDIWSWYSYINLVVAFGIAIIIAVIWSLFDRKRKEYNVLYYWILLIARYRATLGIIAWGLKKFIPKQMELPSRTFLETAFGDFSEQKVYWQSVGITQHYEIFLGLAEITAGVLLLFRKTTALGAALLTIVLFNICIANHAYDGMVHVGSLTYVLLGVIILWPYFPHIWKLVVKKQDAALQIYYPSFSVPWQKYSRIILKTLVISVFIFYSLYLHGKDDAGYRYPHDYPGLTNAAGAYEVSEFRLNNKLVPYSPLDSVRWQDAVFEDWTTLTFKVNQAQEMDNDNTGREGKKSIDKRFEFRGIGGGRVYFNYEADTVKKVLYLQNKNKEYRNQHQVLHYKMPSETRIILSGINEHKDSIFVVLDKMKKQYTLYEERK